MKAMVDIDDTLVQFNLTLVGFFNSRFDTSVRLDDLSDYDLKKAYHITQNEMDKSMNDFYLSNDHKNILPMLQAEFVLNTLLQNGYIEEYTLVTSRNAVFEDVTRKLLNKTFKTGLFNACEMYMLGHFDGGVDPADKKCKSEICTDLSIKIAFEDNVYHAKALANAGCTVYMIRHPWNYQFNEDEFNKQCLKGRIVMCSSWKSILSNINGE
jgi:uncharacterized HAD superfamily protein